jgi:hypothetical protein
MLRASVNVVVLVMAASAGVLIIGHGLFGLTRDQAMPYAILLFALALGYAMFVQRITTGRWTRTLFPEEHTLIRRRALDTSMFASVASLVALFVVGLPLVYALKALGWSKDGVLIAATLAAVPVMAVIYLIQRYMSRAS